MKTTQRYREGGWGWFVVLAASLGQFFAFGSMKGLGVLLHAVSENFETELWIIGSINSLHYGVPYVLSPLTSAIARKVGNRYVVVLGSMLFGLGLVLSSVSHSIGLYAVMLVLIAGTGVACLLDITRAEVTFYFHDKFALANVFIVAGSPIGNMLYGPFTQMLHVTYGWRGAMLLISGLSFNMVWAAMLLRRPQNNSYRSVPFDDTTSLEESDSESSNSVHKPAPANPSLIKSIASSMGLHIFRNSSFILLSGSRMLYCVAYGGVVVYMVPNAIAVGLSDWEASFTAAAFGIGSLIGLVLGALVCRNSEVPSRAAVLMTGVVAVLALAASPFVPTFPGQLGIVFVVGTCTYVVMHIVFVMLRYLPFSDDMHVLVLGWSSFLTGFATSIGDVISGWLYDLRQDFIGTYFLYSAVMVGCMLCLWIEIRRAQTRTRA